jgi:hypothetical protein
MTGARKKTPEEKKADLEEVISERPPKLKTYPMQVDLADVNNLGVIVRSLSDILSVKQGREIVVYLEGLGRRMTEVVPQPKQPNA